MRRAYRKRRVEAPPQFTHFKPSGIPRNQLEKLELQLDEFEAIRLADYEHLEHLEASEKMGISRPTFSRLIDRARAKVASALIDGKELVICGGNFDLTHSLHRCKRCGRMVKHPVGRKRMNCQDCGSDELESLSVHI